LGAGWSLIVGDAVCVPREANGFPYRKSEATECVPPTRIAT
jgi:hypothetical protein